MLKTDGKNSRRCFKNLFAIFHRAYNCCCY